MKNQMSQRQRCYKRQHCDSAHCEASCRSWSHILFPSQSRLYLYKWQNQAKKSNHKRSPEVALSPMGDFSTSLINPLLVHFPLFFLKQYVLLLLSLGLRVILFIWLVRWLVWFVHLFAFYSKVLEKKADVSFIKTRVSP